MYRSWVGDFELALKVYYVCLTQDGAISCHRSSFEIKVGREIKLPDVIAGVREKSEIKLRLAVVSGGRNMCSSDVGLCGCDRKDASECYSFSEGVSRCVYRVRVLSTSRFSPVQGNLSAGIHYFERKRRFIEIG